MRLIIEPIVRAALLEDLGRAGDITTEAIVPEATEVEAVIAARQSGVIAGLDAALLALERAIERFALGVAADASDTIQARAIDGFVAELPRKLISRIRR